jgi:hypothetical protein
MSTLSLQNNTSNQKVAIIDNKLSAKRTNSSIRKYLSKHFQQSHSENILTALKEVEEIRKGTIKAVTLDEFLANL